MIVTAKQICGATVACDTTAEGKVVDLLFDDQSWTVSHLVVRRGLWPDGREILIAPQDVETFDQTAHCLRLRLSERQLQEEPRLESNPPVALRKYWESQRDIAWDAYWGGVFPTISDDGDPHLRNIRAVTGHHVFGLDSEAGRVENFVIDDSTWKIRYLVVHVGKGQEGKRVMVEPRWVDSIVWEERGVHLHLPKTDIEHCGEFSPEKLEEAVF
jgi:hypothetical protein